MNWRHLTAFVLAITLLCSCDSDQPTEPKPPLEPNGITVAILGTGDMGDSFGPRLAALGYEVVYGSRSPDSDKVRALLDLTGYESTATTQKEAAQRGDVVMLALPWPAMETVYRSQNIPALIMTNLLIEQFGFAIERALYYCN